MNKQEEALKNIIADIVSGEHRKTGNGILLSNLGHALKRQGVIYKDILNGKKIGEFIQEVLEGKLKIVDDKDNPQIKVVLPAANIESVPDVSIEDYAALQGGDSQKYHRALWSAITSKKEGNKKRIIQLSPRPIYRDIESSDTMPNGFQELGEEYLVIEEDIGKQEVINEIEKKLLAWAKHNEIDYSNLLYKGNIKPIEASEKKDISLFERMIEAIPEQDLKRVSMPLDVVVKLLRG